MRRTQKSPLLLKDIRRRSVQQWDNDLPTDFANEFLEWSEELPNYRGATKPVDHMTVEIVKLHIIGDSSQNALLLYFEERRGVMNLIAQRACIGVWGNSCSTDEAVKYPKT